MHLLLIICLHHLHGAIAIVVAVALVGALVCHVANLLALETQALSSHLVHRHLHESKLRGLVLKLFAFFCLPVSHWLLLNAASSSAMQIPHLWGTFLTPKAWLLLMFLSMLLEKHAHIANDWGKAQRNMR